MNQQLKIQLFRELFAHANECIIVTDSQANILLVNPATVKLFGYSEEELSGKPIELLMPNRYHEKHKVHREHYAVAPHTRAMGIGMDLYARKKNGVEFPVEISLSHFTTEGQQLIIAFVIDITRRKLVEDEIQVQKKELQALASELKSSNEKLESKVQDRTKVLREALNEIEKSREELNKAFIKERELNELKSRFLSMASHEFRTPLSTILSSASLINEYPLTDHQDKRVKHILRIQSAVHNLNDILSDFLSISKIEEGKVAADIKHFNLKDTITSVCAEMNSLAKPGQKIHYQHQGIETVKLDQKLVRNIMINLISNALKFSGENKNVHVKSSINDNETNISVTDEGIGISAEDKKYLFQRFFRGQNATNIQGTGLGLNIVANYVELMDGMIDLESELGKGTTVNVKFRN